MPLFKNVAIHTNYQPKQGGGDSCFAAKEGEDGVPIALPVVCKNRASDDSYDTDSYQQIDIYTPKKRQPNGCRYEERKGKSRCAWRNASRSVFL